MDNFEQVEKLWNEITVTLEKLSYISAGTISLSITFLGYILGIGQPARMILNFPFLCGILVIYLLYTSWIFLLISLFFGIIVRMPTAWYLFNSHTNLWFTKLAHDVNSGDENNYRLVANSAEKDKDKYHGISSFVRWFAIISFTLGILLLIIFVIIVASHLIRV